MKNRFSRIYLFISLLVPVLPATWAWAGADGYNPAQTYTGKYKADFIYFRNLNNPNWYRDTSLTYPKGVICKEALRHFMSDGKWKGHLKSDGTCGPLAEPVELAVGNRLNYDASSNAPR